MSRWAPHVLGLGTPLLVAVSLYVGGIWKGLPILVILGFYPLLDLIVGESGEVEGIEEDKMFNSIIHLHGLCMPTIVAFFLALVWMRGFDEYTWLGIISVGLTTGASGIVAAHELGHRKPKSASWWLARSGLLSILYLHFTTEHNFTHHKHWARPIDPTSSPRGRGIYLHFLRTLPLQLKGALKARPKDTKISLMVEALLLVGLFLISPVILGVFLMQALVAVFLLEYVNYLQHHGLFRGAEERMGPQHAWESRHRWSRWTLMELPLHPAHHLTSSLPAWKLSTYEESPRLPFGYYTSFWLALFPPLWHVVMKSHIERASTK
jgi:alkane 1-monooxygenase